MSEPPYGFPKPAKGTAYLASKERRADRRDAEQREMHAALVRDKRQCRIPGCTGKFRGLELAKDAAHIFRHRGMGGNPALDRTHRSDIACLCRRCHAMLDGGLLEIQPITDAGTDGALAFFRKHEETGSMIHFFTEPNK